MAFYKKQRRIEELEAALAAALYSMKCARSAIETNQVVDKDAHGTLTTGMNKACIELGLYPVHHGVLPGLFEEP